MGFQSWIFLSEDEDTAEVPSRGVPRGEAGKQSALLNQAFFRTLRRIRVERPVVRHILIGRNK